MAQQITLAEPAPLPQRRRFTLLPAMLSSPKALIGVIVFSVVLIAAVFAPQLAPFDPNAQNLAARLLPPLSATRTGTLHLLGTDHLGRDILSRLIYGFRVSLIVGISTAVVAGVLGVTLGLIAGFVGRWVDSLIMRLCDVQLALPYILIALALLTILQGSLLTVVLVLALTQWVTYARVVRASALAEREKDYIEAARALGMRRLRIMWRYMLPNLLAPVIVIATFSIAQAIISEASLSFLGLGVPASTPSLGGMLSDGRTYLAIAWWLTAFPGLAITVLAIGINLFGDWLRDYLDPKLRL
jgi:peptide/nickel transport system permease protein